MQYQLFAIQSLQLTNMNYKYNKPIRSTVFNYNKLVRELDIENSIPDS